MTEYVGRFREKYGHQNMIVSASENFRANAEWLISYFESEIQTGTVFLLGQSVQIGWGRLQLAMNSEGDLDVMEPDFLSMPINWVRGIDSTFRHLTVQREVCAQLGVEIEFSSIMHAGMTDGRFLNKADEFIMNREMPKKSNTGWILYDIEMKNLDGELHSLYQLAIKNPSTIPFFCLPPGSNVIYDRNHIELSFDDRAVSSHSNKFLQELFSSNRFGVSQFQ